MSTGLTRLKALLPKSTFARNVAVLAGGTAAGQAIVVLASPILTRLYTPEDFGVLAVYSSLLGILSTVAALRYELAIPLPEKDKDAAALVILSLGILIGMILLISAGVWLWGEKIALFTNALLLKKYLWLLPAGVGLVGTYQIFNYCSVRWHFFNTIAKTKLWQGFTAITIQLILGFFRFGAGGLVVGQIFGQATGVLKLISQALPGLKNASIKNCFILARQYSRFPLFLSWSSIFNSLSLQMPALLISSFFGSAVAGQYALGLRVVQTPMSMLGTAVNQVFFADAGEAYRAGTLHLKVRIIHEKLFKIGISIFIPLIIAAPEIFSFVFGQSWQEAGKYVQWLTPWLFFVITGSPLSTVPLVLEKQGGELFFQASLLIVRIIALWVGSLLKTPYIGIITFAIVSGVWWCLYNLWILRLSNVSYSNIILEQLFNINVLLTIFLLLIFKWLFEANSVITIGAFCAGLFLLWSAYKGKTD